MDEGVHKDIYYLLNTNSMARELLVFNKTLTIP